MSTFAQKKHPITELTLGTSAIVNDENDLYHFSEDNSDLQFSQLQIKEKTPNRQEKPNFSYSPIESFHVS